MTQTETALTIAAALLAGLDKQRTAAGWREWLMDEAAGVAKRINDRMLARLAAELAAKRKATKAQ